MALKNNSQHTHFLSTSAHAHITRLPCHCTQYLYTQAKAGRLQAHSKLNKTVAWRYQNLINQTHKKIPGTTSKTPGAQSLKPKEEFRRTTDQDGGRTQSPSQSESKAGRKIQERSEMTTESVASEKIAVKQCRQPGALSSIMCKSLVPNFHKIRQKRQYG